MFVIIKKARLLEQNVFNITLKSFDDNKVLKVVNWIC